MMFPHVITLYHKIKGEDGAEKWLRSVISGVLWEDIVAIALRKSGTKSEDKAVIYIPKKHLGDVKITSGDVVIKGVYDTEIVRSTKELGASLFVTSVNDFDFGGNMKHLAVTAR